MARIVGMPGPTAGSAVPVGRARTLAQVHRHFGEVDAAGTSPLCERVAALSESDEALRAIGAAPARKRHPKVILAALHDLALAGRAPAPIPLLELRLQEPAHHLAERDADRVPGRLRIG